MHVVLIGENAWYTMRAESVKIVNIYRIHELSFVERKIDGGGAGVNNNALPIVITHRDSEKQINSACWPRQVFQHVLVGTRKSKKYVCYLSWSFVLTYVVSNAASKLLHILFRCSNVNLF